MQAPWPNHNCGYSMALNTAVSVRLV